MAIYGYARCSDPRSTTMSLEVQIEALRAAGCTVIRSERRSGTTLADRTELKTVLDFLREGRHALRHSSGSDRPIRDRPLIIVRKLEEKRVSLKATEQPIDTSTAVGPLLALHAGRLRRTGNQPPPRAPDGIDPPHPGDRPDEPKHERTYRGRPPTIQPDEVRRLDEEKLGASEIAQRLGIGRASVYRVLKEDCN
jgi:DNA invertase Pin-like site-specific DNA recombinase